MFGNPVNTDKSTKTAVSSWRRFCEKYGINVVLDFSGSWEERRGETTKLANFLQHESERKYGNGNRCIGSASTFSNYLFGIQRWHQQNGYLWNITYECKWTMKRLRRQYGWGHKRKLPLFLSMINSMEDLNALDDKEEEDGVVILIMLLSKDFPSMTKTVSPRRNSSIMHQVNYRLNTCIYTYLSPDRYVSAFLQVIIIYS